MNATYLYRFRGQVRVSGVPCSRGHASSCSLFPTAAGFLARGQWGGGGREPSGDLCGSRPFREYVAVPSAAGRAADGRGPLTAGAGRGSQTYLGPRAACAHVPGDVMVDRVPLACQGRGRPVFGGPSRPGTAAGGDSRMSGAGRGFPIGERGAAPRPCPGTGPPAAGQQGASAPSPSSARTCTACRTILRASDRAARLPSICSLTCA